MPTIEGNRSRGLSRRQFAAAIAATLIPGSVKAGPRQPRIAVLDWGWAESLLVLGIDPQSVAEAPLYGERVVSPSLSANTIDLGLRSWPNMELLRSLRPDLILSQAGYGVSQDRLNTIAPTMALPLYTSERQPLLRAREGLMAIGERLERPTAAAGFLERWDARLAAIRRTLLSYDGRPLLIVKFADDRLIDIYGAGSLFDGILKEIGVENAWDGLTNNWGFATTGIDAIARYRDARLIVIEPGPSAQFIESALWQALPAVRSGRVVSIPPTWVFGALPSAMRFAEILLSGLGVA